MVLPRRSAALLVSATLVLGALAAGGAVAAESDPISGRVITIPSEVAGQPDQFMVQRADGTYVGVSAATATRLRARSTARSGPAVKAVAASKPAVHRTYVAILDNLGTYSASFDEDAEVKAVVEEAGAYWVNELNGAIPSFDVASTLHYDSASVDCSNVQDIWTEATAKFGPAAGARGAHVVVVVPDSCRLSTPNAAGLGSLGSLHSGGVVIAHLGSAAAGVLTHELGHNLGLNHANVEQCTGTSCTSAEYADLTSVMGFATGYALPALGAVYRRALGVEQSGEVLELRTSTKKTTTTTVTLKARTASSGRRAIHVVDPADGRSYFVEYRPGAGRDAASGYVKYPSYGSVVYARGVVVSRASGQYSKLQGKASDGYWFTAFPAGKTFVNPSRNVSVKVQSTGSTAKVTVTLKRVRAFKATTPKISGTAKVGKKLTATVSAWSPKPTYSYQWYAGTFRIPWATSPSYVVETFFAGEKMTVKVTGRKSGYAKTTRTSRATKVVVR